jgi:DNA-directed RNA polymerase sigma subunit (sigma70/sigma32)
LNKLDLCYASVLGRFAVAQVRDGRKVGCKLNVRDVLSRYCQKRKGIVVERLDRFDDEENQWQEAVVEDTRTSTVPDIVSFRVDFADWLANLTRRDRRIAESLAIGNRTSDVAKRFDVSAGRISQLRRELAASWREFTGETPPDVIAVPG